MRKNQGKKPASKPKKVYRVKELKSPAQKELVELTERHNAIEPIQQNVSTMTLPATFEDTAFMQLYQATLSYVYGFGSAINKNMNSQVPVDFAAGVATMIDGMILYGLGEITTQKYPLIHAIYARMFTTRTRKFRYGEITYQPTIAMPTFNTTMNLNNGDIYFTIPPDSSVLALLTSPASVIVGNQEAYSQTLSVFPRKECPMSAEVDIEKVKKLYSSDPSCFARTYAYFGQNGTTTQGLVNDAELEIPFKMPSFGKFVNYNPEDTQIARVLKLQSGGAALNLAFALTDRQFHEEHLKNPIPVIYKFLDLTELYLYVATTLASIYASQVFATQYTAATPLPFSKYDFFIILRQAVLTQFGASQLQGQFLQPLNQSSGSGQKFKPLVYDPCTIPISAYNSFILPQTIHENLSMLKQCSYLPAKAKADKVSPLRVTYVPVWGVFIDDELPDIVVPLGESSFNLFSSASVLPSYTRITDLTTGSSNTKVNPNARQAVIVLDSWNAAMNKVNSLVRVNAISSDVNVTGNLLIHTRVQESVQKESLQLPLKLQDPCTQFIKDTIQVSVPGKKHTEIRAINVATVQTTTILSPKSVPTALSNTLFELLIPTIRPDLRSSEDKLTIPAWQTYTGETSSQPYSSGAGTSSLSEVQRVFQLATRITAQPFSPSDTMDSLPQAMKQLAEHSWGADLFGQIASGLLGMIPVVGPVLGQAVQAFF